MHTKNGTQKLTTAALLIAVGVAIPMFMPIRIILEPASFTLASHVAIFLSMFISPAIAIAVSIGTTMGFFLGGFPTVVVLRAASHLIFVAVGSLVIFKNKKALTSGKNMFFLSLFIALIHAIGETAVVSIFYFAGSTSTYYQFGFVHSVLLMVGVGTIIHSMIDFYIALIVLGQVSKNKYGGTIFSLSPYTKQT